MQLHATKLLCAAAVWSSLAAMTATAATGPVKNIAPEAKVSANSEYSDGWSARRAVDGDVPEPGEDDTDRGWAVKGATHAGGADFTLEWPTPEKVAAVVYYGRTAGTGDCWKSCEIFADGKPVAGATFPLKDMHRPQTLTLPQAVITTKLALHFTGSYGGNDPGAAEIQVFSEPPTAHDLIPPPFTPTPIGEALVLKTAADKGRLSDAQAAEAAKLLDSPDIFVQALAEWALALRIGHDNDLGAAVWPKTENPAWFTRYMAVTNAQRIDYDYIRHATARKLLENPVALRADLAEIAKRAAAVAERATEAQKPAVAAAVAALNAAVKNAEPATLSTAELRTLWLAARHQARTVALAQPELASDSILCYTRNALHHKPNVCGIHYNWAYKPGGDLLVLSGLKSGTPAVKKLLDGKLGPGHLHGMDLWFDGDRVVFGWAAQPNWPPKDAKGKPVDLTHVQNNYAYELSKLTEPVHLYEFDIKSGAATQLTNHHFFNDLEPIYLPDGAVAFTSDRSAHSPACDGWENDITDTNLYKLMPGGKTIRRITNQKDVDMHPHLLNDGRIGYLRWEYTERGFMPIHSFWVVNADGTMADALYKQHLYSYVSLRDVRAIPGSEKYVGIAAGHHCQAVGALVRVNPTKGVNAPEGTEIVANGLLRAGESQLNAAVVPEGGIRQADGIYHSPYGLSDNAFLVSFGFGSVTNRCYHLPDLISNAAGLYFVDVFGDKELLYRDPLMCVINAVPFAPRTKPVSIPDRADFAKNYATCTAVNVYDGTKIPKGAIKAIRIMESLPWPVTEQYGALRYFSHPPESSWSTVRVIGTVPVEADGSAHFKVPVMTNASMYFQALDENGMELQRMRSSISFSPGETRSCRGCHETRTDAASLIPSGLAMKRAASEPVPPPWGNAPIGYEKLVQPILDRRCASCHGGEKPAGGLFLANKIINPDTCDRTCVSYLNIRNKGQIVCTQYGGACEYNITQPEQFGSHKSKFILKLMNDDKHKKLPLTAEERQTLITWVDANCPYNEQLINKRSGLPAPTPADMTIKALHRGNGNPVREPFPWHDLWAAPKEIPAMEAK